MKPKRTCESLKTQGMLKRIKSCVAALGEFENHEIFAENVGEVYLLNPII